MLASNAATTSEKSDANEMIILYDNVVARSQNINILASEVIIAKRKTDANILANKTAITSKKSDINKAPKKTDASKVANNFHQKKDVNAAHSNTVFTR